VFPWRQSVYNDLCIAQLTEPRLSRCATLRYTEDGRLRAPDRSPIYNGKDVNLKSLPLDPYTYHSVAIQPRQARVCKMLYNCGLVNNVHCHVSMISNDDREYLCNTIQYHHTTTNQGNPSTATIRTMGSYRDEITADTMVKQFEYATVHMFKVPWRALSGSMMMMGCEALDGQSLRRCA